MTPHGRKILLFTSVGARSAWRCLPVCGGLLCGGGAGLVAGSFWRQNVVKIKRFMVCALRRLWGLLGALKLDLTSCELGIQWSSEVIK